MNISGDEAHSYLLSATGALPALISLLREGGETAKERSVAALVHMSSSASDQTAIAAAGGIFPLVALIRGKW